MTTKRFLKTTSIMVILVMLISLSVTLISCNKPSGGPSISEQYDSAAKELKVAVMNARSSDWGKSLTNEQLKNREDAGEYILFERGMDFVISTLKESDIVPVQIKALTELFKREEVKALFKPAKTEEAQKEINKNFFKVLLPLLSNDFTAQDISNIFYNLIYNFSRDVDNIFHDVYQRGFQIYELMDPSKPNYQLIGVAQVSVNIFKYFDDSDEINLEKKQKLLSDIENAKPGINALGEFAYNVSFSSIYKNFLVNLGENGALQDITKSEVKQTLVSILDNFKDFKKVLTIDQISYMNIAFENILNRFSSILLNDGIVGSMNTFLSSLISQITTAYFTIDLLPSLCDVVLTVEPLIEQDEVFLDQVFKLVTDKTYDLEMNRYIMLSKIITNAIDSNTNGTKTGVETKGKEFFKKFFDNIEHSDKSLMKLDKMMGVIGLDVISTILQMNLDNKTDTEIDQKRQEMLLPVMVYVSYKILKVDYEGAKAGIVVGNDTKLLPFQSVVRKFGEIYYKVLLDNLKITGLTWPDEVQGDMSTRDFEEENRLFISGILGICESKTNELSLHNYIEVWFFSAQDHLLQDVSYFANEKYDLIKQLSTYELITNEKGYENKTEYKEALDILTKLGIRMSENPIV